MPYSAVLYANARGQIAYVVRLLPNECVQICIQNRMQVWHWSDFVRTFTLIQNKKDVYVVGEFD